MKRLVSLFLTAFVILSLVIGLLSCGGAGNTGGEGGSGEDSSGGAGNAGGSDGEGSGGGSENGEGEAKPFEVDLSGYVANIGNATALGISRAQGSATAYAAKGSGALPVSYATSAKKNTKDKSYIVMSTAEYGANAPEVGAEGLTKVTFTKIVTENVTTEMTGSRLITAKDGKISVNATVGFTYTLYLGEEVIDERVAEDADPEKPSKKEHLTFDGLTDGEEYRLEYRGVGTEVTVTQDEINGEIDKLYVLNNYTFISFVPEGSSERFSDEGEGLYNEKGEWIYDRHGYSSDGARQSFVIDNNTGCVYPIKDHTLGLADNLVIIDGRVYDMKVNGSGELEFSAVILNETISPIRAFKDKYGNKYVLNRYLDTFDGQSGTVYYTNSLEYLMSDENAVIHRVCDKNGHNTTSIKKITYGFSEEDILPTDRFFFDEYNVLENSWLYLTFMEGNYRRINVETLAEEYAQQDEPIGDFVSLISYKTMVVFYENALYYGDVFGERAVYPDGVPNGIEAENLTLIIDGVVRTDSPSSDYKLWRFQKTTLTETVFYTVAIENGVPKVIDEAYVAPERDVILLQPINK